MKAALLAISFVTIFNTCHADTLTILNWEEYLSEEAITAWESKTGHTVKQIYFDNDEARDSFLVKADLEGIDIAVMDEPASQLFGKSNKFVKVADFQNTPNIKHAGSFWKQRCGAYATPYLWGTIGLAYRNDILSAAPTSWNDLLKPNASLKGHISYLKDSIDTFAPALFTLNQSVNTDDTNALRQAYDITKAITEDLLTLEYPITFVSANKQSNDLHLAVVYSGDQWVMNDATKSENWSYIVPSEGTILWVDCFAVLNKSENKKLAYNFINFINDPAVAASNSEALYVATTNEAAKKLQPDEMLNDHTIYPEENIIKKSQYYEEISAENYQLRSRMASALLKAYESK